MRTKFKEFYKPTEEEVAAFWRDAIFSFDANVLLNLYRYSENTSKEVLDTISHLVENNRVWITYQAALEYQKNRLNVIDNLKKAYDRLLDSLTKKLQEIELELNNFKRHPYLAPEEYKSTINEVFGRLIDQLKKLKNEHPNFFDSDYIFDTLTTLFKDCIGDSFSNEDLLDIYKTGKERYEKKIPPGYMDSDKEKKGEQSLYGDLIIWKELIKKIKAEKVKLIFITDDLKEDWWYIFNGKTISPRPELIKEFADKSQSEIIIYKPEQFLQYFKEHLKKDIKDETLKEVEEIRKNDEKYFVELKNIPKDQSRYDILDYWAEQHKKLEKFDPLDHWAEQQRKLEKFNNPGYWAEQLKKLEQFSSPDYWAEQQRQLEKYNDLDYWTEQQKKLEQFNKPDYWTEQLRRTQPILKLKHVTAQRFKPIDQTDSKKSAGGGDSID